MSAGRVLIADDETTFLLSTADLLRREGFEVETAADSQAAAGLLRDQRYDVIILDVNMSGNTNLEFVAGLRAAANSPSVILVTGYPTVSAAASAVGHSVLAYLIKPFELDQLLDHVRSGVRRSGVISIMDNAQVRLRDWDQAMKAARDALAASASGQWISGTETFVLLSLQNIISVLVDLKRLIDAHALRSGEQKAYELLGCPPPLQMMHAIRQAIEVLERTKGSFKSKELADLRKALEEVVGRRDREELN